MSDETLTNVIVRDIAEIKESMKVMAEAVVQLARLEERQAHDRADIGRVFKKLDEHDTRLDDLEKGQPMQKQINKWVLGGITALVSAALTAALTVVIHKPAPAPYAPALTMPAK